MKAGGREGMNETCCFFVRYVETWHCPTPTALVYTNFSSILLYTRLPQHFSTPLFPKASLHHSSPKLPCTFPSPTLGLYTTPQHFSILLYTRLQQRVFTTLFPNTSLHHWSATLVYTTLLQHFSTPLLPNPSLHHSSPTLLYTPHRSTALLVQRCSSPTLLYTTPPQHFCAPLFRNPSLHHPSPTLLYTNLLQCTTVPQRFSTPHWPNTSPHHSSPTLLLHLPALYITLPQHFSTPLVRTPILLYTPQHSSFPSSSLDSPQHFSTPLFPTPFQYVLQHFASAFSATLLQLCSNTLTQHFSTPPFLSTSPGRPTAKTTTRHRKTIRQHHLNTTPKKAPSKRLQRYHAAKKTPPKPLSAHHTTKTATGPYWTALAANNAGKGQPSTEPAAKLHPHIDNVTM